MSYLTKKTSPNFDMSAFSKAGELKDRILFTLLALIIFRVGSYIPLPGINSLVMNELANQNSQGVLGMFNMLSGGSLGRMSIFALAIMPYITSSIIMQLFTIVSKSLEALKKEGESGRRKITQLTRYLTIIIASCQGFGLAVGLENLASSGGSVVSDPGMIFRITAVSTLVGGTVFLMWLGEQISARGLGNGTSLIIFSGIVAGLPNAFAGMFELGRTGAVSTFVILLLLSITVGLIVMIIFFEKSHRKILVQYPKRQVGNKMYGGDSTHMPLKINTSGVIPPIFASSLLLFPLTIANFAGSADSGILSSIALYLGHGKPLYIIAYIALIMFFSFFYTAVIFNPEETAESLRKNGGFIPGKRPGKDTAAYFDFVLTRLTVIGALYLSVICVLPEVLIAKYSVPFYLGGTSILIVVNVILDTINQAQTHMFSHQYESLIKKVKLREKKRWTLSC